MVVEVVKGGQFIMWVGGEPPFFLFDTSNPREQHALPQALPWPIFSFLNADSFPGSFLWQASYDGIPKTKPAVSLDNIILEALELYDMGG